MPLVIYGLGDVHTHTHTHMHTHTYFGAIKVIIRNQVRAGHRPARTWFKNNSIDTLFYSILYSIQLHYHIRIYHSMQHTKSVTENIKSVANYTDKKYLKHRIILRLHNATIDRNIKQAYIALLTKIIVIYIMTYIYHFHN